MCLLIKLKCKQPLDWIELNGGKCEIQVYLAHCQTSGKYVSIVMTMTYNNDI